MEYGVLNMPEEKPWESEFADINDLTPSEQETLALIAEGWSNAAIAERLIVHERTIEKRITSIFWKLDLLPEKATQINRRVASTLIYLAAHSNNS